LRAPEVDAALRKLEDALPSLSDLFDVRQGVQTGHNPALLLSRQEWHALPKSERAFFRCATMTDSIRNGQIVKPYYLFFPHTAEGALFSTEKELKKAVPDYYQRYLSPNRDRLSSRASIRRSGRFDWWGLMESRSWSFLKTPRIISKYFSGEGGFFADVHPHWQFDAIRTISDAVNAQKERSLAKLREESTVKEFNSGEVAIDAISDVKRVALDRIHFASAAPWWLPNADRPYGLHMNAPPDPDALTKWIVQCVAYLRQELARC
jgi:hypothetical protein